MSSEDAVLCSCGEPIGHAHHCDSCCGCGVADQHERMATVEHLRRCPICDMRFDEPCDHDWLDRPESDTRECLICGAEVAG